MVEGEPAILFVSEGSRPSVSAALPRACCVAAAPWLCCWRCVAFALLPSGAFAAAVVAEAEADKKAGVCEWLVCGRNRCLALCRLLLLLLVLLVLVLVLLLLVLLLVLVVWVVLAAAWAGVGLSAVLRRTLAVLCVLGCGAVVVVWNRCRGTDCWLRAAIEAVMDVEVEAEADGRKTLCDSNSCDSRAPVSQVPSLRLVLLWRRCCC